MSFNQYNDDDSIEENVPMMRSVAMLAPPMPLARTPLQSGLKTSGPLVAPSLKEAPPPTADSWNVTQPMKLPSWHPLSRSHTLVRDVPPPEISRRVADFLMEKSIAAEFNNKEAVATAETNCCVKFSVRLWAKPSGTVVEVQRSSGCGFVFQQVVKGLFASVKGSPKAQPTRASRSLPVPRCLPQIPDEVHEENVLAGVQVACESLCEGALFDACLLATQSLVQLTSDAKCNTSCAKKILSPTSPLLPKLLKLIKEVSSDDALERDHYETMHRNATTTLANCLEALPVSELPSTLMALEHMLSTDILDALQADVRSAATKPHEAAAACRCLAVLSKVMDLDASLNKHLMNASQCRHALLREHCNKLLDGL